MAFLTSFNQTFNSSWTAEQVYGRNDPIANFQGTQRTYSLGWDIPAANLLEAKKNMEKVSGLVKMLYPAYSQGNTTVTSETETTIVGDRAISVGGNALSISKAPLIRLKFANLINDAVKTDGNGLLGYISSLSANPVLDMGMFTATGGQDDTRFDANPRLYPKVYSISVSFTVLHEHDLGKTNGSRSFDNGPSFPFGG